MIAFRISVNEHRMERSVQNMRPRSYGTAGKILRLHKGEIPMFDSNHVFLGIAPIGWCNDDMPELGGENTFQQTVSEMALAGFTGCEIGNKYPKDPAELKKALDLRGMRIACKCCFNSKQCQCSNLVCNQDALAAVSFRICEWVLSHHQRTLE